MAKIFFYLKTLAIKIGKKIANWIVNWIDYPQLWKSFNEVMWLTIIAFLPLIINVVLKTIEVNSVRDAFKIKVLPIELLTFCLSFLAPSMYLIIKMVGKNYKLPYLHVFSIITLILYVICLVLNIITKNNFALSLNESLNSHNLYLKLSALVLAITIVFRIYSTYHSKKSSDYQKARETEQEDFNANFRKTVHG